MAAQIHLDPLNRQLANSSMPDMETMGFCELRGLMGELNTHQKLPGVERIKIRVPVANGTDTRIYTPTGAKGPLPYIFYVHGGGFVAGNINVYDSIATDLVLRTGYALVFPEYMLAPEAQWPTQQEQCFAVLEWMVEKGDKNLINKKFAIMGDSAAGIHIIHMNIMAQKKNMNIPYNVLLNPMVSLDYQAKSTASRAECWNGPFLTGGAMQRFVNAYIPASVDRKSELTSPAELSEETAEAIAPTLIVTSSADLLRDEAENLGERLQKAGRDIVVIRALGQMHDSPVLEATRNGPTPKLIMMVITAAIKERLS